MQSHWYYLIKTAIALLYVGFGAGIARVVLSDILKAKSEEIRRLTEHKRNLLRYVRIAVNEHGLRTDKWVELEIARLEGRRD